MIENKILIVGNSPNRLETNGKSWVDVMAGLRSAVGLMGEIHETKPLSLHYEELLNIYLDKTGKTEEDYLELAIRAMKELKPIDVHRQIMMLPVRNVLTTNYDYCLENALDTKHKKDNFNSNEKAYNLFRRRCVNSKYVWHIHGELNKPNSVMLGHDKYVESCSRVRRYADHYLGVPFKHLGKLKAIFRDPQGKIVETKPHSWVDLFMLSEVHIVGLDFNFAETDLWYLISQKRRLKEYKRRHPLLDKYKIFFHAFEKANDDNWRIQRNQILSSLGVKIESYKVINDNYFNAWNEVLRKLKNIFS